MKNAMLRTFVVLLLGIVPMVIIGQDPPVPSIQAQVKIADDEGKKVKGATLVLYDGNEEINRIRNIGSKVSLDLERGRFYTIEIVHSSYAPKRIGFQTAFEYEVSHELSYKFDLEMQSKKKFTSQELKEGKIDYPVTVIIYDPMRGGFDSKTVYADNTIDVMHQLMQRFEYRKKK